MKRKISLFIILVVSTFAMFASSKNDEVITHLNKGIDLYYSANYEHAIDELLKAENAIYENYTKSITQEVGSFIVNDSVRDYPGEVYEDIYINIYKALAYYNLGLTDDAIVEVNRYTNKIKNISSNYASQIDLARQALSNNSIIENDIKFHNSALGEYLLMLLYKDINDMSTAETANRRIKDAFLMQQDLYNFSIPETVNQDLYSKKNDTRLNLISFVGSIPKKIEEKKVYSNQFMLSLPSLQKQEELVSYITVKANNLDNGKSYTFSLEKIEDLSNIAFETFKTKSDITYCKAVARALTKGGVTTGTRIAGDILSDSSNPIVSVAGNLLSATSMANEEYAKQSEVADLRYCKKLPSSVMIGGVDVTPGTYNIVVSYYDSKDGNKVFEEVISNRKIVKGQLNLVSSSSTNVELKILDKKDKSYSVLNDDEHKFKFDLGVEPKLTGSRIYGMVGYNWNNNVSSSLNLSYLSSVENSNEVPGYSNAVRVVKDRTFETSLLPYEYKTSFSNIDVGGYAGIMYQYTNYNDFAGMFDSNGNMLDEVDKGKYFTFEDKKSGHIIAPTIGGTFKFNHKIFNINYDINLNPFYVLWLNQDTRYHSDLTEKPFDYGGTNNLTKVSTPFIKQTLSFDLYNFIRAMVMFKFQKLDFQQMAWKPDSSGLQGADDTQKISTLRFGLELLAGKQNNAKIKGGVYYEINWVNSSLLDTTIKDSKWGFTIGTGF